MSAIVMGKCKKCGNCFYFSFGEADWYPMSTGFGLIGKHNEQVPTIKININKPTELVNFEELQRKKVCRKCDPEAYDIYSEIKVEIAKPVINSAN